LKRLDQKVAGDVQINRAMPRYVRSAWLQLGQDKSPSRETSWFRDISRYPTAG
jgi:hypothetical protein